MKKFTILLALFIFSTANTFAQWAQMKTNAGEYNTLWVDAVDKNTVWASLDQFANGYYFQPANKVVRTTDGGKNWTNHNISNDPLDFITSIFARSANELWLTAVNYGSGEGKLLVTYNGGQTFWNKTPASLALPGNYPDVIHFYDATHGILLGDPFNGEYQVFTTADAGENWTQIPGSALPDPTPGEFGLQEVYGVAGNATMFGTNGARVLRTPDWGQTWTVIDLPSQAGNTANVGGIAFSDAQNGLLTHSFNPDAQPGTQPKPIRTTDGGLTWSVIEDSNGDTFDEFGVLVHVPGTTGTFLSGNFDGTAYTKDFGVTWVYRENKNFRIPGVDCLDANNCFGSIWHDSKNTGSKVARFVGNQLVEKHPASSLKMKATPNPTTGPVTVTFSAALPADGLIYILDYYNTVMIVQHSLSAGQQTASFNIGNLTPGVYWLKAVVGGKVFTEMFFKK